MRMKMTTNTTKALAKSKPAPKKALIDHDDNAAEDRMDVDQDDDDDVIMDAPESTKAATRPEKNKTGSSFPKSNTSSNDPIPTLAVLKQ